MTRKVNIADALVFWVQDYGKGRLQDLGYPSTNILHASHGVGGEGQGGERSISDQVQAAYMQMLSGDNYKLAKVLEMQCFNPHWTFEDKRRGLRKAGVICQNREVYYRWVLCAIATIEVLLQTGRMPSFGVENERLHLVENSERIQLASSY